MSVPPICLNEKFGPGKSNLEYQMLGEERFVSPDNPANTLNLVSGHKPRSDLLDWAFRSTYLHIQDQICAQMC